MSWVVAPADHTLTLCRAVSSPMTSLRVRTSRFSDARSGCWGLHQQALLVIDLAADIVGQTAIGERHMFAGLQDNDLCVFIQTTGACCATHTMRPHRRLRLFSSRYLSICGVSLFFKAGGEASTRSAPLRPEIH